MPIGWVAAATLVGGAIASSGAQSAADTQANSAANAQKISQDEFNTITAQEQPYMQAGYGAQSQLNYLMGIGSPGQGVSAGGGSSQQPAYSIGGNGSIGQIIPGGSGGASSRFNSPGVHTNGNPGTPVTGAAASSPGMATGTMGMDGSTGAVGTPQTASGSTGGGYGSLLTPFTEDTFKQYSPAYQFQMQQGQQGVLNADSSGQGALSGAAQKDLMNYNQGMANTSFNNAFNQYQTQQGNIYSRLSGIANLGQNAASNTGQQGTALAGQAAQSATNQGSALAAGQVGSANAWSGAVSSLGGLAASYKSPSTTDNTWTTGG